MDALNIRAYGQTDRGLVRDENEDNLFMDTFRHVYAVADGLGGLPGGAAASTIAVTRLAGFMENAQLNHRLPFEAIFNEIQDAVVEEGLKFDEEIGIATTLTLGQIMGTKLLMAHAGDTGVFLFRGSEVKQLTKDHTMAQDIIDRMRTTSQVSIPDYYHHTLTRCVGQTDGVEPDIYECELQAGDRLLMYSDGVTKTWEHAELQASFYLAEDPESLVRQIVDVGNERGGPDNITAIAIFVD